MPWKWGKDINTCRESVINIMERGKDNTCRKSMIDTKGRGKDIYM